MVSWIFEARTLPLNIATGDRATLTNQDRECISNQILTEFLVFEDEHNEKEEAKKASSRPESDDSLLLMFYPYS